MDELTEQTTPITSDEAADALNTEPEELSALTEEERHIVAKVLPILANKANRAADAKKSKELAEIVEKIKADNDIFITKHVEDIRKSMTPPTPDELKSLLEQEYLEFTLHIESEAKHKREFIIRELPLSAETRVLKIIQKSLGEFLPQLASLDFTGTNTGIERLQRIIEVIPGAIDKLAECAAICLDPYKRDAEITSEWVMNNIASYRLLVALDAQLTAGRYRDFFSHASRLYLRVKTA